MLDIDLNVAPTIDSNATTGILDSPEAGKGGDGGTSGMVTAATVQKQQETETHEESKSDNILGNGGSLQLLIEAARYVEENESKLSFKRCLELGKGKKIEVVYDEVEEIEDETDQQVEVAPPVVRSKRGRSQVLPNKYRDSVMEPLARLTRPERSDHPVPTKRRSSDAIGKRKADDRTLGKRLVKKKKAPAAISSMGTFASSPPAPTDVSIHTGPPSVSPPLIRDPSLPPSETPCVDLSSPPRPSAEDPSFSAPPAPGSEVSPPREGLPLGTGSTSSEGSPMGPLSYRARPYTIQPTDVIVSPGFVWGPIDTMRVFSTIASSDSERRLMDLETPAEWAADIMSLNREAASSVYALARRTARAERAAGERAEVVKKLTELNAQMSESRKEGMKKLGELERQVKAYQFQYEKAADDYGRTMSELDGLKADYDILHDDKQAAMQRVGELKGEVDALTEEVQRLKVELALQKDNEGKIAADAIHSYKDSDDAIFAAGVEVADALSSFVSFARHIPDLPQLLQRFKDYASLEQAWFDAAAERSQAEGSSS